MNMTQYPCVLKFYIFYISHPWGILLILPNILTIDLFGAMHQVQRANNHFPEITVK